MWDGVEGAEEGEDVGGSADGEELCEEAVEGVGFCGWGCRCLGHGRGLGLGFGMESSGVEGTE